jgi:hypothetical protein
VRSYYKTKLIVKNEHKDVNFEDCKIIFGNKECDFNELIIEDPKEITRIQTLKIIHPKYDEYNVSNFYITEDEVKAIYLPDHKIKPNYRTKASEKSKATNNQSNGTQRKKKENETNDWIIIIGVFIISCAGMFGLFKLFNYLNRPDIEFVEQVNPPETQKDTTTNSKGQQPDTDTIKKGENQQLETDGNKPSNAGNGKTIKEDKKRKEEDKKRKEEDKKRKEEEDKKRKEENKEIIENNNSNTLENEFWQYVHMQEPKIGNFIKLSKKVNKDFKYYDYLQKVSKKSGFDKFKKIEEIERINARKITDIQF